MPEAELQEQWITVPFTGGIEQKLRPELVPKTKLINRVNYSLQQNGTPRRRDALVALSGASGLTSVALQSELATLGQELVTIDGSCNLLKYAPKAAAPLQTIGLAPCLSVRKDQVSKAVGVASKPDMASASGVSAFVWINSGTWCAFLDETTGSVFATIQLSASVTALNPRVAVVAGRFCFIWTDTTHVWMAAVAVGATTAVVAPFALSPSFNTGGVIDIVAVPGIGGNGSLFVAYSSSTANHDIDGQLVDNTGATTSGPVSILATGANLTQLDETAISVVAMSSTQIGVAVGSTHAGPAYNLWTFVETITAGTLATNPANNRTTGGGISLPTYGIASVFDGTVMQLFWCPNIATAGYGSILLFTLTTANVVAFVQAVVPTIMSAGGDVYGPVVAGKAFIHPVTGAICVPVQMWNLTSNLQNALYLIDLNANVIAQALYGEVGISAGTGACLPSVVSTGVHALSLPFTNSGQLTIYEGVNISPQGICRVQLTGLRGYATADLRTTPLWHASAAKCLYFSGGQPMLYDGHQIVEASFIYFPTGLTAATTVGGIGPANAGAYQYIACFEWYDAQGNRHQSSVSPPISLTGNGHTVNLTSPWLLLGVRAPNASIVWFRTQNAGTIFYRVNPPTAPVPNTLAIGAADATTTDALTDALISTNEPCYTQPLQSPTVLPNDNIGPTQAICQWQGRLVASLAEDRYSFVVSQAETPFVGLQWSGALLYRIPRDFGEIVALGVEDEKLIIFTPSRKFWMAGALPDSTGLNAAVSPIYPLPTDVGCVDQRTVVLIPDVQAPTGVIPGGLGFQSQHGYYLLTRALTDSYIGSGVEPLVVGQTISSAVVLQDKSQLRLCLPNSGTELVYDLLWGNSPDSAWGKFYGTLGRAAACVWNGLWTVTDFSNNQIAQEKIGTWLDLGTTGIIASLQVAWLELNKFSGFQRVWRAAFLGSQNGSVAGDSALSIAVDFDYLFGGAAFGAYAFAVPSTAAIATSGLIEFRHHLQRQRCQAVAITITDTPNPAGNGAGVNWTGLKLLLAIMKGAPKLPAAQST